MCLQNTRNRGSFNSIPEVAGRSKQHQSEARLTIPDSLYREVNSLPTSSAQASSGLLATGYFKHSSFHAYGVATFTIRASRTSKIAGTCDGRRKNTNDTGRFSAKRQGNAARPKKAIVKFSAFST